MAKNTFILVNNLTTGSISGSVEIGGKSYSFSNLAGGTSNNGGYTLITASNTNLSGSQPVTVTSNGASGSGSIDVYGSGTNTYVSVSITQNGYANVFTAGAAANIAL